MVLSIVDKFLHQPVYACAIVAGTAAALAATGIIPAIFAVVVGAICTQVAHASVTPIAKLGIDTTAIAADQVPVAHTPKHDPDDPYQHVKDRHGV
jgi:hypothetical protein